MYIYDITPLSETLEKYINYQNLSPDIKSLPKAIGLIVTALNVLTANSLLFDTSKMQIELKHLLASVSYPNYGFSWVEVDDGIYLWDRDLSSNTHMREVIM